jgi:hypothetical protein
MFWMIEKTFSLNSSEITTKTFSVMSVIKSIHSSISTNVVTVLMTRRNFVMELQQSSLFSSIFPSSQTRWKFWTIGTLSSRRGIVLDDAAVDFVFVAMIDIVVQVKMLLFISNVGIFFFFHPSAPPDRRNVLKTKGRER